MMPHGKTTCVQDTGYLKEFNALSRSHPQAFSKFMAITLVDGEFFISTLPADSFSIISMIFDDCSCVYSIDFLHQLISRYRSTGIIVLSIYQIRSRLW
jgi:hypothetical protein